MPRLVRTLAVLLLAGTVMQGIGAALHPVLPRDAAAQLRVIADTPHWRTLHLVMLAGAALITAGVWVRLLRPRPPDVTPVLAALALVSLGLCVNALNTAYMTGAGWRMGVLFGEGRRDVVALFELTHPIGLMAGRLGNLIVALGALVLGFAEWNTATQPRWIAALAWAAAAGGFVGVCFDEGSPLALAAVALLSGWQVATAVRAWRDAGEAARGVRAAR